MNTPPNKKKKVLPNKIYRKNIKARGQKLQISRKFSKNKPLAINNKINSYKNDLIRGNDIKKNIERKNILEEIKNTTNKIKQYENYLKKSANPNLPNDIKKRKILSSYKGNDYIPKHINLNNIINSINTKNNDYNKYDSVEKNTPNISLINNSLIFNYMNKVNNNISVGNNNSLLKSKIKSTINSIETSNDIYEDNNSKNNCIITPNYKKGKVKIKIKNSKNDIFNKNLAKNNLFSNIFQQKFNSKKAIDSFSCSKYNDSSFGCKYNSNNISNIRSISIKKEENVYKSKAHKKKNIKLDIKPKKHNIRVINNIRRNTFIIEKLIDDYMEKKLEKEKIEEQKNKEEKETEIEKNQKNNENDKNSKKHIIKVSNDLVLF